MAKKNKYPVDREKTSQAFANSEVTVEVMRTHPRVIITIGGDQSEAIVSDLQHAVDEVLKHHGK